MTPLKDYFSKTLCDRLKEELNIDFIEQTTKFTDESLLKIQGLGKVALQTIRNLNESFYNAPMLDSALLPAEIQINEKCTINLGRNTLYGKITGVSFIKGKYFYDAEIEFQNVGEAVTYTRIHRIEAYLVKKNNH